MGLPLGSQELASECIRRQDEDPQFKEKIKGLSAKLIMIAQDCPGNEDRQLALDIENGRILEIIVTKKPAPSDLRTAPFDRTIYQFRIQAPQQTYIDMIIGKMNMLEALPLVKIEGDFAQLMAKAAGFMAFIEFLKTMDIVP